MFPDFVDTTKLVPDETRAGHWLYPPTGEVFHAPGFSPLSPKTDSPPPSKETLSPPPQARSEEPADE